MYLSAQVNGIAIGYEFINVPCITWSSGSLFSTMWQLKCLVPLRLRKQPEYHWPQQKCNRPNLPLAFPATNWGSLYQTSSRISSSCTAGRSTEVPWEPGLRNSAAWHQHAGGWCLTWDRVVWGPRSCIARICVCVFVWKISAVLLSSKLRLENKHFLISVAVPEEGLDTSLLSWDTKELDSTHWIWPITTLYSSDQRKTTAFPVSSSFCPVLPSCDHIPLLPWGCCLPNSAWDLGLSAGKGEDHEYLDCLSNLASQTGQPGRDNKHHTLNYELDAQQCKLPAKNTTEEQLPHLEHLGVQWGRLGLGDLVGLAEQ